MYERRRLVYKIEVIEVTSKQGVGGAEEEEA